MNPNSHTEILQTSFRVALGATQTFVELVCSDKKRWENFSQFQMQLDQVIKELAAKGELLEQEAYKCFENFLCPVNPVSKYPYYVERGGEQTFTPPFTHHGAKLHCFLLKADRKQLQSLCDKYLNNPTNGRTYYRPLISYVALVFANIQAIDIPATDPAAPTGSIEGWIKEIDVAFWVPLAVLKRVGNIFVLDRLAWFLPYIFVDNGWAMAGGREIYGFPKEISTFQIPDNYYNPPQLSVDTVVLNHFSPQTQATVQRLIEVNRVDGDIAAKPTKTWNSLEEAFESVADSLFDGNRTVEVADLESPIDIVYNLIHKEVPMAFLKQFRDVRDGKRACYQAIIEAPAKLLKFRAGSFLQGNYKVILNNFDSHPLASELGLKAEQSARAAFWLDFDFRMETGTEIWKAP